MITNNGEQFVQSPPLHHMTLVSVLLPSRCSLQQTDRKQCVTHLKACLTLSCLQSLCWSSSSAYCPRIDTGHIAIIFLLTVLQNDSPPPIHSLSIFVGAMTNRKSEVYQVNRNGDSTVPVWHIIKTDPALPSLTFCGLSVWETWDSGHIFQSAALNGEVLIPTTTYFQT